jgi:hypothetical protein
MSTFLDNFQPDPEMPDEQWIWRTAKPLLRDAVVTFAPFYPEYPGLEVGEPLGSPNDPSSPSARVVGNEVDVTIYSLADDGSPQERAWNYILEHRKAVEASLRRKLLAYHSKSLMQLHEEMLPDDQDIQKYWKSIESQVRWDDPSAIDHLFKLVAVGLADTGLDEYGFSSFEFQTGWDRDHGLGILMHKDRVLAAGGMTELIDSPSIEGIRSIQEYDLDEGDFSLLND